MAKAGRKRIHVNAFERELLKAMEDRSRDAQSEVKALVQHHGKRLLKEVKKNSPKRTREYKKSWRINFEGVDNVRFKSLIYNKDHYRLTHLLEHGHIVHKKDGTTDRSDKFPHLLEAEERISKEFMEDVKKLFANFRKQ